LLQNIQRQLRFVPWFVDKKHDWQNKPSRNIHKRKTAQQTTTHISICAEPADKRKSKIKGKRFTMARITCAHGLKTKLRQESNVRRCGEGIPFQQIGGHKTFETVGQPLAAGAPWNLRHFRHTLSQITFEQ
jgi:hypothetical protein